MLSRGALTEGVGQPRHGPGRISGEEALVTTTRQRSTTDTRETSERASYRGQDESRESVTISPAALARVLASLRGRARSHPESPATGLYPISNDFWRNCIAELRRGYHVSASVATQGDRATNEIGYTLADEPPSMGQRRFAAIPRRLVQSPPPSSSVDRSPGRATERDQPQ